MNVPVDEHITGLLKLFARQTQEYSIIALDLQGRITWWNHASERLFGYTYAQALGKEFAELFTPSDRERGIPGLEMQIAGSDAVSEDDRWHLRADGSQFFSTGILQALRDQHGDVIGYLKLLRDRTNMKEQLELLDSQVTDARAEARSAKLVIATVSHELRNLLATMKHGLNMLRAPGSDAARRETLATLMQEHVEIAQKVTDDLLDAQRMKTGKVTIVTERLVLQEVLGKVVEAVRPRAEQRGVGLHYFKPEQPVELRADGARVYQIFSNLLDNAVKYTGSGGSIWVKFTVEEPDAVVHIEDTGVGIPPDKLSMIFELFTQIDPGTSQRGLGIGLALVQELVLLHGGSVQARSEGLGKGSEFSVRLPLAPAA